MATITGSVNTNSTNRPFVGSAANDGGWGSSLTDPGGSPASTATSSGSFSVVGTATLANGYGDGNGIPTGVTISYDASFTITELNGFNLADGGDNGFGVDSSGAQTDSNDTQMSAAVVNESVEFSAITYSNIVTVDSNVPALLDTTPGATTIGSSRWTVIRSNDLAEASEGATVETAGGSTWGFGTTTGTDNDGGAFENNFSSGAFTAEPGEITLTADAGDFRAKGIAYSFDIGYTFLPAPPIINTFSFNRDPATFTSGSVLSWEVLNIDTGAGDTVVIEEDSVPLAGPFSASGSLEVFGAAGQTKTFEITVTNGEGSDTATTTVSFEDGVHQESRNLLANVDGNPFFGGKGWSSTLVATPLPTDDNHTGTVSGVLTFASPESGLAVDLLEESANIPEGVVIEVPVSFDITAGPGGDDWVVDLTTEGIGVGDAADGEDLDGLASIDGTNAAFNREHLRIHNLSTGAATVVADPNDAIVDGSPISLSFEFISSRLGSWNTATDRAIFTRNADISQVDDYLMVVDNDNSGNGNILTDNGTLTKTDSGIPQPDGQDRINSDFANVFTTGGIVGGTPVGSGDFYIFAEEGEISIKSLQFSYSLEFVAQEVSSGIAITDAGLVDADTFFIEFSYGGSATVKVVSAPDLNFASSTEVTPTSLTADRVEFDITADRDFFRLEVD